MVSKPIRISIVGVGNVASALVQSVYVKNLEGVWHKSIGGYGVKDVEIVSAFDVDKNKVGKDLSEAIFSKPNSSPQFSKVPKTGITVQPGIVEADAPAHLKESLVPNGSLDGVFGNADIVLNLIPSGMQRSSLEYADAACTTGCSFVNATPALIATNPKIRQKFARNKLVVVGDDLLSQFGGTAFHKGILDFINSRGIRVVKSYQLDVGGGAETLNTITEEVKLEKRKIKTQSIASEIPYKFETVAGTTDYVDYMGNNRTGYFWILGKAAFGSEIKVDVYLRTNDGANAVNVLLDVIRAVAKSKHLKNYGAPKEICNYGFKNLPIPGLLREAHGSFLEKFGR